MEYRKPADKDGTPEPQPRGRTRVPVDYPVTFTGDSGTGRGMVRNLTISGGEIESDAHVAVGVSLSLHVQPPGARPPIGILLAIVQWKQDNRFGIEFVRFEGDTKQQLQDMLNQRDDMPAE